MKYYIIAGEASGDLHGSNLMKALCQEDTTANIRFWGGDLMQNVGGTLVKHYRDLSFMGFLEVVLNLKTILNNIAFCKTDIEKFQPDVIIFIDYPGFNMRIAKWAKLKGIKTHYYIAPQIWAWKESRIAEIKRDFDKLFVILPFEKDFFEKKHHFPVEFVGHPLIDAIHNRERINEIAFRKENNLSDKPIIAILPGSRKQEIAKMLSVMLSIVDDFDDYQFVIAGAPSQEFSFYEQFLTNKNVKFISNKTYDLLSIAVAALVTSGTATLETALFKCPMVIAYRMPWLSWQIMRNKRLQPWVGLPNILCQDFVVPELLQNQVTPERLAKEVSTWLEHPEKAEKMNARFFEMHQKLIQDTPQLVTRAIEEIISPRC